MNRTIILTLCAVAFIAGVLYMSHTIQVRNSMALSQPIVSADINTSPHVLLSTATTSSSTSIPRVQDSEAINTYAQPETAVVATTSAAGLVQTVIPGQKIAALQSSSTIATALFADGCFWSTQRDIEEVHGVISTVAGYAGGTTPNPTYENYVAGGYREAVLVTYNPQIVSYANLVEHIIKHGDPTDTGGSFYDRGPEYVPAIYYSTQEEDNQAHQIIAAVDALKVFAQPLPLLVIPKGVFYPAEDYHQDYAKKNPIQYGAYRLATGRDAFIQSHWGNTAETFTITARPLAS